MHLDYRVPYTGTLTQAGGNADLLYVAPADDKPVTLFKMRLGQTSEVQDAGEENLLLSVCRLTGTVTAGSGGSAVTPVGADSAAPAAGFTARCNDSTVATGTLTVIEYIVWNVRANPTEIFFEKEDLQVKQGEALVVRCDSTVNDDMTIAVTFLLHED